MNKDEIGKLIKDSLSNIVDHAINLTSDDDILGEIPIIKYIASINKVKDAYRAHKMYKNVMSFLDALSENEDEIVIEEKNIDEFIDTLSLILIESEKPIKAQIVGNLTESLAKREINFTTFNHLCLIIHSASVPAINLLCLCANDEMMHQIESCGIQPNVSIRISGVLASIHLLSSIGVITKQQEINQPYDLPKNLNLTPQEYKRYSDSIKTHAFTGHTFYVDHLNGYGMALIKFGKMYDLPKINMKTFVNTVGE